VFADRIDSTLLSSIYDLLDWELPANTSKTFFKFIQLSELGFPGLKDC
jgi:hypothetical protein